MSFEEISSSLDSQGRIAFLSPPCHSALTSEQAINLLNGSFQFPSLPADLPRGHSQGYFRPVSMIILNFPYHTCDRPDQGFTVISSEWANSPAQVTRCHTYGDMVTAVSRTQGNSLVIPFLEGRQSQNSLVSSLLTWLPYFCWPSPVQSELEIEQAIADSFVVPTIHRNNSSQISLGSEGSF